MSFGRSSIIIRLLLRLEETALVLLVGALIGTAFAQIILRNLLSVTFLWTDPLVRHLVLWSGFVGAMIATRQDKHIRIDALLRFLSPPWRDLVQASTSLFSALVCFLLTWVSLRFLGDEMGLNTRAFLHIPTWELQLIFPLSFGAMTLRFLFQCGLRLRSVLGRQSK